MKCGELANSTTKLKIAEKAIIVEMGNGERVCKVMEDDGTFQYAVQELHQNGELFSYLVCSTYFTILNCLIFLVYLVIYLLDLLRSLDSHSNF